MTIAAARLKDELSSWPGISRKLKLSPPAIQEVAIAEQRKGGEMTPA
jgi:hypothetical protein